MEVIRDQNYRTIIVSGLFGGHRPGFFEAVLYTDEMVADEALKTGAGEPTKVYIRRTLQCRLLLDPVQAKSIAKWLTGYISEYEKTFGKIITLGESKPTADGTLTV